MSPTDATRGTTGPMAAPRRVFLSHTSDLGKPDEPGSFVGAAVAAVLRARHAVTDMAYFAARDTSPAAACGEMVAQSDVYVGIIGLRYGSPVRDLLECKVAGAEKQLSAPSTAGSVALMQCPGLRDNAPGAAVATRSERGSGSGGSGADPDGVRC